MSEAKRNEFYFPKKQKKNQDFFLAFLLGTIYFGLLRDIG